MAFKSKTKVNNTNVPPVEKTNGFSFKNASRIGNDKYKTNQEAYDDKHGKLYDMTHNNTISWRRYVVYMILVTMLSCCFTYSKYMSNGTGVSSVSVAKFSYKISANVSGVTIDANNNMPSTPTITFDSDDVQSFDFTVNNYSDVSVNVYPAAENTGKFSVSFKNKSNSATLSSSQPMQLASGASGVITMYINPSGADNKSSSSMSLKFKVDQVD